MIKVEADARREYADITYSDSRDELFSNEVTPPASSASSATHVLIQTNAVRTQYQRHRHTHINTLQADGYRCRPNCRQAPSAALHFSVIEVWQCSSTDKPTNMR